MTPLILRGLLGLAVLLAIAVALSEDRRRISVRLVVGGLLLQLVIALCVLYVPGFSHFFQLLARTAVALLDHSSEGASFVFGSLTDPESSNLGFIFAFQVLPTIIFFSALSSLLFYFGIIQKVVGGLAWLMARTMRLSGVESLAAAANIFVGQTEAPLLVRPYLKSMGRSELMTLMTGGMATIAGGVLVAYIALLGGDDPESRRSFATALLCASLMSAPAAVVIAKILVPDAAPAPGTCPDIPRQEAGTNALDAITRGTTQGLILAANVGAILLVFMALASLLNTGLDQVGQTLHLHGHIDRLSGGVFPSLSLEAILGFAFAPLAWLIGIPSHDLLVVGRLLGEKTVLNEFIAYASLAELNAANALDQRSVLLSTYALCGFANFASIGIQIGGIGAIEPSQRHQLASLGFRALVGGTLACLLTANLIGLITPP